MTETFTAEQVRERLRKACEEAGSQRAWARKHGVSEAHVSRFLDGQYRPGAAIERAMRITPTWRLDNGATAS